MTLNSYAKLNLYLAVLNKRKDNYHNLRTIFERISLADKIILKPRRDKKIRIISDSKDIPKNSANLALRSAKLLQGDFNIDKGVDIKIIKRIPVGSGLGGGSSNAATVLLGLNKLWKLNLSRNRLVSFARKIGADAPFFIYNSPFAEGKDRGDRITPLSALKDVRLWHILVVPRIKVSTPVIYKAWDRASTPPFLKKKYDNKVERAGLTKVNSDVKILNSALKENDILKAGRVLFNGLNAITYKLYPGTRRPLEKLDSLGLKAILMSGSGPAVFGIVSSRKEAVSLYRQLKGEHSSWRVFVTRTV